jgi:hypothetical protein
MADAATFGRHFVLFLLMFFFAACNSRSAANLGASAATPAATPTPTSQPSPTGDQPVQKGEQAMSADAKQTLVRRFFEEVWNHSNLETAKEIVDNHFSSIENQAFPYQPGLEIVDADMKLYQSLYDGLNFQIERMFTEGDIVVTIWKATGVSKTKTFTNRAGKTVPKSLNAEGISLTEVKDGKITAHRFLWPRDALSP